jgi:hypothetical protein
MKKIIFILALIIIFSCRKIDIVIIQKCTTCTTEATHWANPNIIITTNVFEACGDYINQVDDSYGTFMVNGQLFMTHTTCKSLLIN